MSSEHARSQQPTRDLDIGQCLLGPQRSAHRPGHDPERGLLHQAHPAKLFGVGILDSGARHDQFPQPRIIRRVDLRPNNLG